MQQLKSNMKTCKLSEALHTEVDNKLAAITTMRGEMTVVLAKPEANHQEKVSKVNEYAMFEEMLRDIVRKCLPWTVKGQGQANRTPAIA